MILKEQKDFSMNKKAKFSWYDFLQGFGINIINLRTKDDKNFDFHVNYG